MPHEARPGLWIENGVFTVITLNGREVLIDDQPDGIPQR